MDMYSLRGAARELATTPARVHRALVRLGLDSETPPRGRPLALGEPILDALRRELGVSPRVGDLTVSQTAVLAALTRAPRGVASARAVARRAGVSPTSAATLVALSARGLARREQVTLARGRARRVGLWRADPAHPDLARWWEALARVRPPRAEAAASVSRVPRRFAHLFWTGNVDDIELPRDARFVARRLLETEDPDALAWGITHLPRAAWLPAANHRGSDIRQRALASAIAGARTSADDGG